MLQLYLTEKSLLKSFDHPSVAHINLIFGRPRNTPASIAESLHSLCRCGDTYSEAGPGAPATAALLSSPGKVDLDVGIYYT